MLNLFQKKNSQFAVIIIIIAAIILHLLAYLHPIDLDVWQHSAPLANNFNSLFGETILTNTYINFTLSILVVFIQLLIVYRLFSLNRNVEPYALLGTWIYLFILHLFPYWSFFNPALLGSTALALILYILFNEAEEKNNLFVFHLSFITGISFLIWYPSILWLVSLAFVLFTYNSLYPIRISILIFTFLIPIINYVAVYFFIGKPQDLLFSLINFHLQGLHTAGITITHKILLGIFSIICIVGFMQTLQMSQKTNKQTRLFLNGLNMLILIVGLSLFLSVNKLSYSMMFLLIPISLYLAMFLNIFKRKLFAEIAHLILILLVVVNMLLV